MNNLKRSILLTLVMILSLFLMSCSKSEKTEQANFQSYLDNLFVQSIESNSMNLRFNLTDPKEFGLDDVTPSLPTLSIEEYDKAIANYEKEQKKLSTFDYEKLTAQQQLTYDILYDYYETELLSKGLYLYNSILSPNIGTQAQLPIFFAEYPLTTKQSIGEYFKLISEIPLFFTQIIELEKQKAENGLFMADFAVDDIVAQCKEFITNPDDNFMIEIFNTKLEQVSELTQEERNLFIIKNKELVKEVIVPSYEYLIASLLQLKGQGVNNGGLVHLEEGQRYYEYLVRSYTGSNKPVADISKSIDNRIQKTIVAAIKAITDDQELAASAYNETFEYGSPEETLEYLKEQMETYFTPIKETQYEVKRVHPSLAEHISPAFYLIPPIDNQTTEIIYINYSDKYDLSTSLYSTLAHEGFPGHLYQTVFFRSQEDVHNIRQLLNFSGYAEGWASYAENFSYYLTDKDPNLVTMLQLDNALNLLLVGRIDIGVNYEGWDIDRISQYLTTLGLQIDPTPLYQSVIEEPANVLKYTVGYNEVLELKEKAQKKLGDNYKDLLFHDFILKTGPAPFHLISQEMDSWEPNTAQ